MPITIEVRAEDIDAAREYTARTKLPWHSENCPIARSLCRQYGIPVEANDVVGVGPEAVVIAVGGADLDVPDATIPLPPEARDWIMGLDCGKDVGPIRFELPLERLPDVTRVR